MSVSYQRRRGEFDDGAQRALGNHVTIGTITTSGGAFRYQFSTPDTESVPYLTDSPRSTETVMGYLQEDFGQE